MGLSRAWVLADEGRAQKVVKVGYRVQEGVLPGRPSLRARPGACLGHHASPRR